ncbi:MAG: hypothetical protein A3F72_03380 [Bacteroidetes bacterium RIFCSPLOWO2_12_FULL_35_15]|nr:MAG: hypothetical protein A3F72_03380 [Bacteroidetes bacterium RIFCSPLOWO2_12_FULL_35_15]
MLFNSPKRILICPLDWGLGHATRCIPVIRLLIKKNAEVIIAADGRPFELLKQEFPDLEFVRFEGYDIQYPEKGSMVWKMILSISKILKGIKAEHQQLDKLITDHKIDGVISDNRYGCWSKKVKSVFVTHQLMIKTPFAENILHKIVLSYIKKFNECWVPDFEGVNNLSGDLAHKYPLPANIFYIGPLSRFTKEKTASFEYDVMAIISGPEPQRSLFEKIMLKQLSKTNLKALLVEGKTEMEQKIENHGNVKISSHLRSNEMQDAISRSKIIIARSGYSTIMDLAMLGKRALFIPTPGQTEQEYLAELLMQKNSAYSKSQEKFDLEKALKESENYKGFDAIGTNNDLEKRIDLILFSK